MSNASDPLDDFNRSGIGIQDSKGGKVSILCWSAWMCPQRRRAGHVGWDDRARARGNVM